MRALALALGLLVAALPACAETRSLRFDDTTPARARFDRLTYLGGLEWRVGRPDFGGFSGLALEPDGQLVALTDKAHWFRTRPVFGGGGALKGLQGLTLGRLYREGRDYLQSPRTDSEALVRLPDGGWLVSFERDHRIARFADWEAGQEVVHRLPEWQSLGNNRGIEAMALLGDGRLVAVAEEPASGRDHQGWVLAEDEPPRPFRIARRGSYSPTDLALSPDGASLYLLERRYNPIAGPGMAIRRFPVTALEAGDPIEGEVLIDRGAGHAVDNMEGLAAFTGPTGADELLVISDDNFSARQRTLLLHFRVVE